MSAPAAVASAKTWLRRRAAVIGSIVATTSPDMVLTLDDGPDPDQTPRVLEVLAAHDATATFFVLLTRARRHPDLLRAMVAAGHEVALHGPDHRPLTEFGFAAARERTVAARRELEQLAGVPVRWFRPPYGSQTPLTWLATRRAGLMPVMWTATTWDWREARHEERLAKALAGARPGGILLAHDGFAGLEDAADDGPPALADRAGLLGEVLDRYHEAGLRGRSLGEALHGGRAVRAAVFSVKQL